MRLNRILASALLVLPLIATISVFYPRVGEQRPSDRLVGFAEARVLEGRALDGNATPLVTGKFEAVGAWMMGITSMLSVAFDRPLLVPRCIVLLYTF